MKVDYIALSIPIFFLLIGIELAYTYTAQNSISPETAWRIDVIAINMDQHGNVLRLSHIRNAIEEKQ